MKRIRRNLPFLKSLLNEANRNRRQELLQHANSDQINTMSEMIMNLLKNNIPIPPPLMARLKRHKKVLREVGKRKNSIKRRRQHLMSQKGSGFWKSLNDVFCQCLTQ